MTAERKPNNQAASSRIKPAEMLDQSLFLPLIEVLLRQAERELREERRQAQKEHSA